MQSFRFRLAARFAATMFAGLLVLAMITFLAIREALDRELNASLLNVASIQAASVTDAPSGEMRFHEWELTPEEAAQVRDLNRYAQVWSEQGESLLRTRYITADLPLDRAALARALAGELVWDEADFAGLPVRSLFYPLGRLGHLHEPHVLQVAAPLVARNQVLRAVALALAALTLLISAGTFAGSWWLAARAVRPVREIIDQAEAIGGGTIDRRISADAENIEYQRLVQVLNTMLGRIAGAFTAQRRFTADASHELRSPLTALRGEIELALRRPRSSEEYERVLRSAQEEVERLSRITEDLLTLARSDAGVLEARRVSVDLSVLARDVAPRLQAYAREREVRVHVEAPEPAPLRADPDLLSRLAWNLATNAIKASPPGAEVTLAVKAHPDAVSLEVL
ncbi:MAG TPA: histidine kinase dimerization/phospho-acceptor domain-containing protein, partial [Longimicrobiales bacterium]|nr:histidine kinase dimerization/phospho-acceptor domain-containing protein [Longimicrobiales bacterium]